MIASGHSQLKVKISQPSKGDIALTSRHRKSVNGDRRWGKHTLSNGKNVFDCGLLCRKVLLLEQALHDSSIRNLLPCDSVCLPYLY